MMVGDIDRSVAFYREVLGFEKVSEQEVAGDEFERLTGVFGSRAVIVRMKLGGEVLDLTQFLAPRGRPMPPDSRSNDLWFQHIAISVRDMDEAYARLRTAKVEHASSGPQRLPDWNRAAGGIHAFYFRDPDGHFLEVLQFPPDKGDSRWHRKTNKLFLGVDHTAIVVADTDASLKLYRDVLGMRIVGTSENYGTEQEHLNNIFGARLRITTLRGVSGPGIELLEYLSPRGGRPWPADAQANDILHWHTTVAVRHLDETVGRLRAARTTFVSPDIIATTSDNGHGRSVLIRDPDGHAILLTESAAPGGAQSTPPPTRLRSTGLR
jgi:catechol 2,3-dioxygenase-like lactoylglutathione lyase family enzyme